MNLTQTETQLLSAVIGAAVAGVLGFLAWLRLNWSTHQRAVDMAHAERIVAVENTITEEVLPLYGINIHHPANNMTGAEAPPIEPQPDLPVTTERVRYLVAIVNAQNIRFGRNNMGKHIEPSALTQMWEEDYMPRLFAHKITRDVWRHARRCFRDVLRDNVDTYLKNHPKWKSEFTAPAKSLEDLQHER